MRLIKATFRLLDHSTLKPTTPSFFPLSFPLESCPKAVGIPRRSSTGPPLLFFVSGDTSTSPGPRPLPSSSPHPGAPTHSLVRFLLQPCRVEHPHPISPVPARLRPHRTAVPGREARLRHHIRLRRDAPHPVDDSIISGDHRSDDNIHDRAAAPPARPSPTSPHAGEVNPSPEPLDLKSTATI